MSLGLGLASPGIVVKEVDLTKGSTLEENEFVGVVVGPFEKGPVEEVTVIRNEDDLVNTFGKPKSSANQFEYFYAVETFLSYGGVAKVIRSSSSSYNCANILKFEGSNSTGVGTTGATAVRIKNDTDYNDNYLNDSTLTWEWSARNPGTWANTLKICTIDDAGDQIISGIDTSFIQVGAAVTFTMTVPRVIAGVGTTSLLDSGTIAYGVVTEIASASASVKWNNYITPAGVDRTFRYRQNSYWELKNTETVYFNQAGNYSETIDGTSYTTKDWYDQQKITLDNVDIFWKSIAPKPSTTAFASSRNSWNDAINIAVIDDTGLVTGNVGNLVEKFNGLSKASNASVAGESNYYKEVIARKSNYIFAGAPQDGVRSKVGIDTSDGLWGSAINNSSKPWFNVIGNKVFTLSRGVDDYATRIEGLSDAYDLVSNPDEEKVDFLIAGPTIASNSDLSRAKINLLISVAEQRKDCIVVTSPYREDVLDNTLTLDEKTTKITTFFTGVTNSTYAVFDSGYKYIYDRFNKTFRYVACNPDIAGLMVRTSFNYQSWYSPAGVERGQLLNAIKLAYNPNQQQRDELYNNGINPVIYNKSSGTLLFGDKTAIDYATAFDRINVRRLFLEIESVISNISKAFLFEFNDEFTRASFVNQVEPYLRDIEAKRGITEFLLVCDETNNTPDVIDRNEFVAEIYVKPARSINFIGLTFVATRTGISLEEVVGRF